MLLARTAPKVLLPVPNREWRSPSLAQPKDQFGNPGVQTRFRLRSRLNDGHVKSRVWFDSRDDADAFLWSLAQYLSSGVPIAREDWGMVNTIWGDPDLYPDLQYDFATVTFLTTTGSNQTYNKPSDWVNAGSSIEGLGGGGSGAATENTSISRRVSTGGGGGEYSKIVGFAFSGSTATYRVGSAGSGVTRTTTGTTPGNPGTVTYFNSASDPGAGTDNTKLGAKPGLAGAGATSGVTVNGGAGGSGGWGSTKVAGGRGGNITGTGGTTISTGGGGTGGPTGAAGNGVDNGGSTVIGTNGGTANGGTTSGGAGTGGSTSGSGTAGSNSSEWGSGYGPGSGGGGGRNGGGGGGLYGGGGGSSSVGADNTSGAGAQGLIVVSYTPVVSGKFFMMF